MVNKSCDGFGEIVADGDAKISSNKIFNAKINRNVNNSNNNNNNKMPNHYQRLKFCFYRIPKTRATTISWRGNLKHNQHLQHSHKRAIIYCLVMLIIGQLNVHVNNSSIGLVSAVKSTFLKEASTPFKHRIGIRKGSTIISEDEGDGGGRSLQEWNGIFQQRTDDDWRGLWHKERHRRCQHQLLSHMELVCEKDIYKLARRKRRRRRRKRDLITTVIGSGDSYNGDDNEFFDEFMNMNNNVQEQQQKQKQQNKTSINNEDYDDPKQQEQVDLVANGNNLLIFC